LNALLQLPVLYGVRARRTATPGVVSGGAHLKQGTEPSHGVLVPLGVDERERVSFRVAQNRMAFFKRACSSCRRACARSSAWSLRISRGGGSFTAVPRFPRRCPSRTAFRHRDNMNG
jgi:hypothetical protein